ncbi:plasmid partitioning protein RepB [Palleronia sp. LCG004]|uniref:plasmid partitioning protein RepB n=1 Tax=Palleronia sp. LCG004 TaxID=3079304 RepID=UPI0029421B5B|nr:plasmid partitioning protein RepB [Palleronia sp. LCG004]WOI58171.1 plasmid partitioning protein RepB [Palleronia sp. LCG004]
MSESRKKRMSMLDDLASAGHKQASPAPAQASGNRALRAARDAVDGHNVWDLDPYSIENQRLKDRLEPGDLDTLRDAIETNGQTVPILVRRHPENSQRYLLVYGLRRLMAIQTSDKVKTVRAIIANVDEDAATRAQISENMARRDLTYIERALFARELIDKGFGNQAHVAEILTVTKSSVSMALGIVDAVGRDLAEAIGPAPGIGRPRWEVLANTISDHDLDRDRLASVAHRAHGDADRAEVLADAAREEESSVAAFEAVMRALPRQAPPPRRPTAPRSQKVALDSGGAATIRRSDKGLRLDIPDGPFADWLESDLRTIIDELHARYKNRAGD